MALPIFAAALPTLLATLEKWTEWSRISAAPDRIDELEARIAELETGKTAPALEAPKRAPGRPCPACGAFAGRRTSVARDHTREDAPNARIETWTCTDCGDEDEVETPPRA